MNAILHHRFTIGTVFLIVMVILLFATCINEQVDKIPVIKNSRGESFAGSASCAGCHQNIYERHLTTAHFLTSQPATSATIRGSFKPGQNSFAFDTQQSVLMEQHDSAFYQVAYKNGVMQEAHRFDFVIGSGIMGQSYLTWNKSRLFQLPITYFSAANQWSNSPGYPNKILFSRPITSRCLECHSTFAKTISPPEASPEKFDRRQLILGVTCEKCHGPGANHLAFQTSHPKSTRAQDIINPARLSRQQQLDLCASCHGGRLQKKRPSFEFTAGDTLSNFFALDTVVPSPENIDVHGNQYGLLAASKCFRLNDRLTCSSCHNTHEKERGNTALFSQRCISCHAAGHEKICPKAATIGEAITTNCIDCHMPLQSSRAIAVFLPGKTAPTAALIRSHYIRIYPEAAASVLRYILKKK